MTQLPVSNKLPVEHLAACFSNVTNSYKFYWFLSILEHIKETHTPIIPLKNLLGAMVANVWYPTNYFCLSFGKQDRLSQIALKLKIDSGLTINTKKKDVAAMVLTQLKGESTITDETLSLERFVPYRFLRPFFVSELRGLPDWKVDTTIAALAKGGFDNTANLCLYRFVTYPEIAIEIQSDWFEYLQQHIGILTGFCLWHLINYLQKNNPNVPNLANKLFEPEMRDLKQAKTFWQLVFNHTEPIQCVYSGQPIFKDNFSLDHFLPWRFVTHDLLWNIIPTSRNVNSAKSDNLPDIDRYFASFAQLQYNALQIVADSGKPKPFEDYVLLFRTEDIAKIKQLSFDQFRTILHDTIVPQIQIAKNMGFTADWSYSAT
jgi:hypothetical protein